MALALAKTRLRLHAIASMALATLLSGAASPYGAGCATLDPTGARSLATTPGIQTPPNEASLYGHVYSVDGKPVAGARVRTVAISDKVKSLTARTDKAGRYVLKGLSPGAVGVVVEHPRLGKMGPLPVRLWESMQGREIAQPLQFDIGGLGDGAAPVTRTLNGPTIYVRTVKLASKVRRFTPDGRGGLFALTAEGVLRVSPQREPKPVVALPPPTNARAAAAAPSQARVTGPGAPAADIFVGAAYGRIGDTGNLSRHRPDGSRTWCLDLPVKPAQLGVAGDGTTWLVGTSPQRDLAIRVTPGGRVSDVFQLANGTTYDVAVHRAGHAWFVNGLEGLVRFDASGKLTHRITVPMPVKTVYSTPDGGVWAVGGSVAGRYDRNGKAVSRLIRPQPIAHSAIDGEGRLWILDDRALLRVDGQTVTKHPLQGKSLPQTMSMAGDGGRHIWLLGPDRQTAAIVDLPCDCGH